jgi:hypothetical protein
MGHLHIEASLLRQSYRSIGTGAKVLKEMPGQVESEMCILCEQARVVEEKERSLLDNIPTRERYLVRSLSSSTFAHNVVSSTGTTVLNWR